jgi:hypothetical protein
MSELDEMAARFAHDGNVTDASPVVSGPSDERATGPGSVSDGRYFVAAATLKSKMIEWLAHVASMNDKHEGGISAGFGLRTQPHGRASFKAPITHGR